LTRFDPAVPRIGAGIAALGVSALTFGLMVILPSGLEQKTSVLAVRAEAHGAAASAVPEHAQLRCTVPSAFNAPLFPAARAATPDPHCKPTS